MAKTAYLLKKRPRAPSRMDMAEIAEQIAFLAGPQVSKSLRLEALAGASAWKDEAIRALEPLLRDPLSLESADSRELIAELGRGLERPVAVGRDEIREHAGQSGRAITSAWLQFLALALGEREELALDESLLPAERSQVRRELWLAFDRSLTAFALDFAAVPKILQAFADGFVHGGAGLKLPFGLTVKANEKTPYVLRRSERPGKGAKG